MPAQFYFWTLVAGLAITLAMTLSKPQRIYEYPYFMAAAFTVFIVPQAVSLIRFPGAAKEEWIANVLLVSCLCFGMCWVGYQRRPLRFLEKTLARPINQNRLFFGGLVFIAIGFFFNYLISQMTDEETGGTRWSGKATIYIFFGSLIYPGFAIALSTALRTNLVVAWMAAAVATIIPLQATILNGRREHTVQFLLTLALTIYYQRNIKPPRLAIVFSVIFAMLAIPATGTYRTLAAERDWNLVKQIELIGNFQRFLNEESVLELRNAALTVEATRFSGDYQFGAGYWDHMVFRFVPAQLLGREFKERLMFQPSDEPLQDELFQMGYEMPIGSTLTGMADSFQQFGWFGCLFFAALGLLFKTLFRATQRPNAIVAQLFYILTATSAMRAITHQTIDFLPGMVYNLIFLGILFLYAREPQAKPSRRLRQNPSMPKENAEGRRSA